MPQLSTYRLYNLPLHGALRVRSPNGPHDLIYFTAPNQCLSFWGNPLIHLGNTVLPSDNASLMTTSRRTKRPFDMLYLWPYHGRVARNETLWRHPNDRIISYVPFTNQQSPGLIKRLEAELVPLWDKQLYHPLFRNCRHFAHSVMTQLHRWTT
jgi:hypothetical protein